MKRKNIFITKSNSKHLVFLLILSVIFLLTFYKNIIYTLLFPTIFIYQFFSKVSFRKVIIYLILSFIPSLMYFFVKEFNFLAFLCNFINTKTNFILSEKISNFLDLKYDSLTANFIKLMILNIKAEESYILYKKMINLSIVYLIVISGFHLMFIKKITNFIFKKIAIFQFIFNFFLFFFYSYLLNFNASVLRVFLCLIISKCFKSKNQYDITSFSGILILFFIPSLCFSLSFQLSYICTFGVIFVISLSIRNKIIEKIMINIFAILISLPFVISINSEISLLAIINSYIFAYFFCFIFMYFFLSWFLTFLWPIHYFITALVFNLIEGFNIINIKISLNFHNLYLSCSYYILIFLIIMITYKKTNYQW